VTTFEPTTTTTPGPDAQRTANTMLPPLKPGGERPEPRVVPSAADRIEQRRAAIEGYALAMAGVIEMLEFGRFASLSLQAGASLDEVPHHLPIPLARKDLLRVLAFFDAMEFQVEKGVARAHR
jgi:hypothetical protein